MARPMPPEAPVTRAMRCCMRASFTSLLCLSTTGQHLQKVGNDIFLMLILDAIAQRNDAAILSRFHELEDFSLQKERIANFYRSEEAHFFHTAQSNGRL